MTILDNLRAEPELKQVYSRMGFKPAKAEIPDSMKPLVNEAISLGRKLLEPLACYDFRTIRISAPNRIEVDGTFSIESEKVFSRMEDCSGLYLAAVTLGSKLDHKVAELSGSREVTRAFLLNSYGAEAAEALMESLNRVITALTQDQGQETTKRYSPGYGDWPITAQRELLKALQAERIGIQLTEHYAMLPEKSVSAIIGTRQINGGRDC